MDVRLRDLLSKDSSRKRKARLKVLPYDYVLECQPPIMGSLPVAGNGPDVTHQLQRAKARRDARRRVAMDMAATPPDIQRIRPGPLAPGTGRDLSAVAARASTAPHGESASAAAFATPTRRTRSGFSLKSPPKLEPEGTERRVLAYDDRSQFCDDAGVAGFHMRETRSRRYSSHIDLFDAVAKMDVQRRNPSRHRVLALGGREFGEDVADRNLVNFGTVDCGSSPDRSDVRNSRGRARVVNRRGSEGRGKVGDGDGEGVGDGDGDGDGDGVRAVNGCTPSLVVADDGARDDIISPRPPPPSSSPSSPSPLPSSSSSKAQSRPPQRQRDRLRQASSSASTIARVRSQRTCPNSNLISPSPHSATSSFYIPDRTHAGHHHLPHSIAPSPNTLELSRSSTARTLDDGPSYQFTSDEPRSRKLKTPPPVEAPAPGTLKSANKHSDIIASALEARRASVHSNKSANIRRGQSNSDLVGARVTRSKSLVNYTRSTHTIPAFYDTPTASVQTRVHHASSSFSPIHLQSAVKTRLHEYNSTQAVPINTAERSETLPSSNLPTPPMSPINGSDPAASGRRSVDKALPAVPSSRPTGNSATYTSSPRAPNSPVNQNIKRQSASSKVSSDNTTSGSANSDSPRSSAPRGNAFRRSDLVVEGASERPSLDGVVDLSNTVDTEVITRHAPAVVHETVIPTILHETQQLLTREVHTHDVFHRILPVVDVEVLPTKHFIPDPQKPGSLIEIPAAAVPGRQTNWQLQVNPSIRDPAASSVPTVLPQHHYAHAEKDPVLSSKRTYQTAAGHEKTEYVWRHSPELDTSAYHAGETKDLPMNCVDTRGGGSRSTRPDGNDPGTIEDDTRRGATGAESPLFDETGYGAEGGMLPGLKERSPVLPNAQALAARSRGAPGSETNEVGMTRNDRRTGNISQATKGTSKGNGTGLDDVTQGMRKLDFNGRG
ncbi:MAG: hypothetical protein M1818_001154 [Claussenomyces sp. TS43310]|nr:MAG: hypothetical protein M1818_001154 [Claussenomyces sp. TS43310]